MGIKLDLEPQELDVVLRHVTLGQWQAVDAVVRKIMAQANDPSFQAPAAPPQPEEKQP